VSLEGSDEETNDLIRGPGNHKKALEAIELLKNHEIKTIITSTATKFNVEDIPRLSDLLFEKNAQTHHILWVHKRGRARENPVFIRPEKLSLLMSDLESKQIKIDNWDSFKSRVYGRRGTKVDGCHAGFTSLSIDSNGDVYPCPALTGEAEFLIGKVNEGLESVWKGCRPKSDIRGVSVKDIDGCDECEFRFFCGGGCRCQAYYAGEEPSLTAKDPYCEVIKFMLLESILSYTNPNGHGKPEVLGYMKEEQPPICGCDQISEKDVSPFRCTCVLDVESDKQITTESRYREGALKPQESLCCPTDYSTADLEGLPDKTISISYGCGNPTAFADLEEGENVLDIGSGGGIDCFIAAKKVGKRGMVIGVDMTDEMLKVAISNKEKMLEHWGHDSVEFRKGFAESLPVNSGSIDLVMSNCVINLSPDKRKVFEEVYRVLKSGGRFCISDIVSDNEVPIEMKNDDELWSGCISGALTREDFLKSLIQSGFRDVNVEKSFKWKEMRGIGFYSVTIRGKKP
jgi:radical SAM protein with 4Fe4S-binding SPASM domain